MLNIFNKMDKFKACRICLSTEEKTVLTSMFEVGNKDISHFEKLTNVKVNRNWEIGRKLVFSKFRNFS